MKTWNILETPSSIVSLILVNTRVKWLNLCRYRQTSQISWKNVIFLSFQRKWLCICPFLVFVFQIVLFLHVLLCVCVLRHVWLFTDSLTVACQAPMFTEFSRQEYWSGLPFPTPGHLPDSRMEPGSPVSLALATGFFTTEPPGKLPIF